MKHREASGAETGNGTDLSRCAPSRETLCPPVLFCPAKSDKQPPNSDSALPIAPALPAGRAGQAKPHSRKTFQTAYAVPPRGVSPSVHLPRRRDPIIPSRLFITVRQRAYKPFTPIPSCAPAKPCNPFFFFWADAGKVLDKARKSCYSLYKNMVELHRFPICADA